MSESHALEELFPGVSFEPKNISWEHFAAGVILDNVDFLEIPIGSATWFGFGAVRNQRNLSLLSIPRSPVISADPITPGLGNTGFLGIVEPFWFNSEGLGLYVETDQLIDFSFNSPTSVEGLSGTRPYILSAITVPTDKRLKIWGKKLRIKVFRSENAQTVVSAFHSTIATAPTPPLELFEKPLWTTWANFKNDISQDKITAFANKISSTGLSCSIFGIDAKWQKEFGDTSFDPQKFPNPRPMTEHLHGLGYEVTLWNVPFFNRTSENFARAIDENVVLQNSADNSPYIGKWWEGEAAFLDLTREEALNWHLSNLRTLANEYGLDGFKFDAGEAGFYMDESIKGANPTAPQSAGRAYIKKIGEEFPWSDARTGSRTQGSPILLRQWDKSSCWGFNNGLASCITQTITLGLLGYRFTFADMIGGNEYGNERIDAELMIRWTQALSPMPFIQFSIPPWRYGKECTEICRSYVELHRNFAPISRAAAERGEILVKPLWWIAPNEEAAINCEDQYLVTDRYMVAPILTPETTERDIYLPKGIWKSYWDSSEEFAGEQWLRSYPAPLERLPLFEKVL